MNTNTTIAQAPVADQEASASSIVRLQGVSKIYGSGDAQVRALDDVSVGFGAGEFTAIMGPSGSGKSTMMHILAGLDAPTSGHVFVEDTDITALKDTALTKLRRDRIGFVFQSFNLVPTLDARANILLPMRLAGATPEKAWFDLIVTSLGIADRLSHRPSEMSGGQQQRVAVARALMSRPAVIVADEPTGNLDSRSTGEVMDLLRHAVDELGQSVIMVTHDTATAAYADRVLVCRDGRIVSDLRDVTADSLTAALR
ncbi:MAG: ABC transporter ATP-binding protein [Schaalia odontolytica]